MDLRALKDGMPALTPAFGASMAEAASVCFDARGHQVGVVMPMSGTFKVPYAVSWEPVTDQARRTWNDMPVSAEHGAYGIALLAIKDNVGFVAVERSRKGTGFDYWLGDAGPLPFEKKARLEVSGLNEGTVAEVEARREEKIAQTAASAKTGLPAYAVVIEFGAPRARTASRFTRPSK
jgi:hypothetical protein